MFLVSVVTAKIYYHRNATGTVEPLVSVQDIMSSLTGLKCQVYIARAALLGQYIGRLALLARHIQIFR